MLTLTQQGLNKQAQAFIEMAAHGSYKLDGVAVENAPIYKKTRIENIARVYIIINDPAVGVVSEIKLQTVDNVVIAQSDEVLQKPEAKGLYATFKYKFTEQEAGANE